MTGFYGAMDNFGSSAVPLNGSILVANNAIHAGFLYVANEGETLTEASQNLTIRFDGKKSPRSVSVNSNAQFLVLCRGSGMSWLLRTTSHY